MITIPRGNYAYTRVGFRGLSYPIVVSEDTTFEECNFMQQNPHTTGVFSVAPGVRLVLKRCNLINVTVPDEAEVVGGNLAHLVPLSVGGRRGSVNLLHECDACAAAQRVLRESLLNGTLAKTEQGFVDHDQMKARFRARRLALTDGDRTQHAAENDAVASRYSVTIDQQTRTRLGR